MPIKAHATFLPSIAQQNSTCTPSYIYVTNARRGGSGGAGGKGALIGSGGGGGAGGGGGDSGSVSIPWTNGSNNACTGYYTTSIECGGDGASVTAAASSTKQPLKDENRPYSTVSFSGGAASKNYYLKPQAKITMPAYSGTVDPNETFVGWKVKTPASKLSDVSNIFTGDVSGLAAADETVYAAGQEVAATGIYGAVEMEPVFAAKDTFAITKLDGVDSVTDASGNTLSAAYANQSVTVTAENREGYELTGFTVSNADGDTTIADISVGVSGGLSGTFNMPGYAVQVKANYQKKNYNVSVTDGKLTVKDGSTTTSTDVTSATAQVENTVTFTADDPIAGQYFDHWEFWSGSQQLQATDLDIQYGGKASDKQLTIKMPPKDLTLKAVFEDIVTKDILFEDECGFARVNGKRVTAATSGDTVTIAAAAQDEMVFDYWEMFDANGKDITEKLADAKSAETTFTMPNDVVTLKAYYKPIPAGGGDTTISADGSAAIGAIAVVGAGVAVWQGSELAMHIYRNRVIQIGYWPGNRIQLAQLLWSRAGSPEPESDVPYVDITEAFGTLTEDDATAQKAARWCVEQGLLDGKVSKYGTERFEPLDHVTHLRVCLTWQTARERGLFETPAKTE